MKPVRIKYYGLVWMTKRTYLLGTLITGLLATALLVVGLVAVPDRVPPFSWPWEPVPAHLAPGFGSWFYHHFWTIIIVLLFAEAVDIFFTLRKFAEEEAVQRQEEIDEDSL